MAECRRDLGKWSRERDGINFEVRKEKNIKYKKENSFLYSGDSVPGNTLSTLHILTQLPSQNGYLYSHFTAEETKAL